MKWTMSVPYIHVSIVLAICVPKIIKFDGDLTKFWQKQVGTSCHRVVNDTIRTAPKSKTQTFFFDRLQSDI